MKKADVIIVGAGIVGLATAYSLVKKNPGLKVIILEKENSLAKHQTGHNSGVLHSGIYYKPGSLKAKNCREGKLAMEQFCCENEIDYDICGKVIVAVEKKELPAMENIYKRGRDNGISCELIDQKRLNELEPHASGVGAIHVPEAGIVNYRQVCEKLAKIIVEKESEIFTGSKVTSIKSQSNSVIVEATQINQPIEGKWLINCAGLYSDKVTSLTQNPDVKIIPFRGEYFELKTEAHHLCKNLIYPVPDPNFPFLGVHFTHMIDGTVECGPNAVLAGAREGYKKTDINFGELMETITYPAFWKIALKYWQTGLGEMHRSISKSAFVKALQRLVPDIRAEHLEEAPAGIRAQALSPDGKLVDDFLIQQNGRVVNVCNAPSPAATASLNIGRLIVEQYISLE